LKKENSTKNNGKKNPRGEMTIKNMTQSFFRNGTRT